jgi:pyruvate dehydrogenase E2 component (dihydrolipoamide acetyltransferase)
MNVVLPKVALTMTEATILEWHKQEGDPVEKGELLFSIETDKADLEMEAEASGQLEHIFYSAGDVVPAGAIVASLRIDGEEPPDVPAASTATRVVAPAAQQLAEQLGVDLDAVTGSGTGGRVIEDDVIAAATRVEARTAVAPERRASGGAVEPVTVSRARATGMRLTEHATKIPTFSLGGWLDLAPVWERMQDAGVTVTDVVAVAAARALKDVPIANACLIDGRVHRYLQPRVAILARVKDALLPVVFDDPSDHAIAAFSVERRRVFESLEDKALDAAHASSPSFVISNLGPYDVDAFTAVLFPNTAVTMALGSLGSDASRPQALFVTLTCDHRILDGVDAARFLNAVRAAATTLPLSKHEGRDE